MFRICWLLSFWMGLCMAGPLYGAPSAKARWQLGEGDEATVVVVNRAQRPAWVTLHLIPRGSRGVISPPLLLRAGQEMAFNLRYFLPELEPGKTLRGRLKVRFGKPTDRIEVRLVNEEVDSGRYQTSSQLAEFSEDPIDPCLDPDACSPDDPLYIVYDHFEYREWDVDGDGITDPEQRSSLVIYDSNGSITWADSLYAPKALLKFNPPKHDMFCASQVRANCVTQRCSIVEYVDTPENGRVLIGGDFLEITTCPNQEPRVEVFGEDVTLDGPQLFYSGCVQSASLHFNSVMDAEVAQAKEDLIEILREFLGIASTAAQIDWGGVLKKGPKKIAGRFIRNLPLARVVWDELRAIDRGHEAQLFVRENACAWVTAERLCYETTETAFGPQQMHRSDIYAILDFKGIDADVVQRHCAQP